MSDISNLLPCNVMYRQIPWTIDGELASSPEDDLPPLVRGEGHQQAKATTRPLRMTAGSTTGNMYNWLCDSS